MDLYLVSLESPLSNSNTVILTNRSHLECRRNCQALPYNRPSLTTTNLDVRWMTLGRCLTAKDLHLSSE